MKKVPQRVLTAKLARDREALSRLGRAGGLARARNRAAEELRRKRAEEAAREEAEAMALARGDHLIPENDR